MSEQTPPPGRELERRLAWLSIDGCTCEYEWRNDIGHVYGISMGSGWVRQTESPACPHHAHGKSHGGYEGIALYEVSKFACVRCAGKPVNQWGELSNDAQWCLCADCLTDLKALIQSEEA